MKKIVRKIFPPMVVRLLRKVRDNCSILVIRNVSKSEFFSGVYYIFISEFSKEHQAVLKGKKAYYDSLKNIRESSALLRRNTHRLEKGLIMQPRRSVFAEGFILETVLCYKDAIASYRISDGEKKWAKDVLSEYFRVVGSTPVTEKARAIYEQIAIGTLEPRNIVSEFSAAGVSYKPYFHDVLPSVDIDFSDIKKLFIRRRSVRWYQDKEVPAELVQRAANIASFAPSACNRQSYRFLFCNDKKKAVSIAKCAGGTTGFAENLPSIIVVVGSLASYPHERDRHLIYIDSSLAAMQFMLALETLGLSTCSINWPEVDLSEREIRKIVNIHDYERVVMLLAVGYADVKGGIPFSQKKENSLILEEIS